MLVPVGIFVISFAVGAYACGSTIPSLGVSRVGQISSTVVCVLLGVVAALVALHVYEIVRELNSAVVTTGVLKKPDAIGEGLETLLRDAGPVLGLAATVYLLAPTPEDEEPTIEAAQTAPPG